MDGAAAAGQLHDWPLPNAAWEAVCQHLALPDLLVARLVCRQWRSDLGSFVSTASTSPSEVLGQGMTAIWACPAIIISSSNAEKHLRVINDAWNAMMAAADAISPAADEPDTGDGPSNMQPEASQELAADARAHDLCAAARQARMALQGTPAYQQFAEAVTAEFAEMTAEEPPSPTTAGSMADGVRWFLGAFPLCRRVNLHIDEPHDQELAASAVDVWALATTTETPAAAAEAPAAAEMAAEATAAKAEAGSGTCLALRLNAVQRSYHCHSRQDHPSAPPGSGPRLFGLLGRLPQLVRPAALACVTSLVLDTFPEQPEQWLLLRGLPSLRELLLPSFRPALPHEHLPSLAQLTQLQELTLSVQGSFTAWRANCAAFASLARLTGLRRLVLHAFHCPGAHLASAVMQLRQLEVLQLSGRVVLEPLVGLTCLTGLRCLGLTQDVQHPVLCELVQALTDLTHLTLGRVTLPRPSSLPTADPLQPWIAAAQAVVAQQPDAAAAAMAVVGGDADNGGGGAVAAPGHVALGAAAAAGALPFHPVPPGGQGPAAAAAAAAAAAGGQGPVAAAAFGNLQAAAVAEGAVGEVMLEDVGAIVDGLIGNLEEGAVPLHLQRIIERFENIIQLDLTRRSATSPWSWPVAGVELLEELRVVPAQQHQWQREQQLGWPASSGCGGDAGSGCKPGCIGLELALLKPADARRLSELPQQLHGCRHLGLRLRDQLLAFASVCPVRLKPGQLSGLGATFTSLASLSLCGKVAIDGGLLLEMVTGFDSGAISSSSGVCGGSSSLAYSSHITSSWASSTSDSSVECASSEPADEDETCQRLAAAATVPVPVRCSSGLARSLVCLSLDCHFVSVSAESMTAALQQLSRLEVLSLLHRGGGKLPLPLAALPPSLHTLAVKKVMLFQQHAAGGRPRVALPAEPGAAVSPDANADSSLGCHALTSPGFRQEAACIQFAAETDVCSGRSSPEHAAEHGAAGCDAHSSSSSGSCFACSCSDVAVQHRLRLRSLHLKNCLVASDAVPALLGVPASSIRSAAPAAAEVAAVAEARAGQGAVCTECGGGVSSSASHDSSTAGVGTAAASSGGGSQLQRLLVAGDTPSPGEAAEAWSLWLAAIRELKALQVLDITVPEALGSSPQPDLLEVLLALPRLSHLHITVSHNPQHLLRLGQLRSRLRMLGVSYTGPPALPQDFLAHMRGAMGAFCKIHIWEQLVMQHADSFGSGPGEGAAAAGPAQPGAGGGPAAFVRRRRGSRLGRAVRAVAGAGVEVAGVVVPFLVGWCAANFGIDRYLQLRRRRRQRARHGLQAQQPERCTHSRAGE